jgi:hypothetical protein
MKNKHPVEDYCLCADDLPAKHTPVTEEDMRVFSTWWQNTLSKKFHIDIVTKEAYEDLVTR